MIKHSWIEKWAEVIIQHRKKVIALTFLSFILFFIPFKNLYFDNSNEMWFVENDPALVDAKKLRDLFGNSEYLLVGVETPEGEENIFNEKTLRMIAKISSFLEDHEYVDKVSSITKYQYMKSKDDSLDTKDLIPDIESRFNLKSTQILKSEEKSESSVEDDGFGDEGFDDEEEGFSDSGDEEELITFEKMEEIMKGETLVHDYLISQDFKHTIISARTVRKEGTVDHHVKISRDLYQFITQEKFLEEGAKLHLSGNPIISEQFLAFSMSDQGKTYPLMIGLIILFLIFSFRSKAGILMPLFVIIGSVIIVIGVLGMLGWPFNMLNVILPTLLMAVGIGDSVHIIVEYYHFRNLGQSATEAAKSSIRELWIPCFNTSLTTSIGFLALSVSDLVPLRQFGVVAAIGVTAAFLLSVTALPALLSFAKAKPEKTKKLMEDGLVARFTRSLAPFTYKYGKLIFVGGVVITVMSVYFSSKITVDANFVNYFKEESTMRKDILYFDDVYNGFANLEFMLDSKEVGGVKNPHFLKKALEFQNYLESLEEAGKTNSLTNYIRKMNQVMHNDDPAWHILPETRELTAQYLLLYENSSPDEDLSDLKDTSERHMRISLKLKNMSSSKMKALVEKIDSKLKTDFSELNGVITGDLILFNRMDVYIQEGLVKSFSIALALIVICFFFLLRSVKYGLLAMIPSLFPIVFSGGLLYLMGVNLDFGTMIVAAVTFGIAVDDTIHVMNRYIQGRNSGKTRKEAIHGALTETGRALVFTSAILYAGFSMLMLSSLMPNFYFGFFAGVIILMALVSVLLLLPAVMFLTGDKEAYDVKEKKQIA